MTNENKHSDQNLTPWQPPTIITLSISRDTEQGPLELPDPGAQS